MGGYHHALTRFANSRIHQNVEADGGHGHAEGGGRAAGWRPRPTARTDRDGLAGPGPSSRRRGRGAPGRRRAGPGGRRRRGRRRRAVPGAVEWWDEAVAAASPAERAAAGGRLPGGGRRRARTAPATATRWPRPRRWPRPAGRRAPAAGPAPRVDGIFLAAPEGGHTPAGYGHATSARLADVTDRRRAGGSPGPPGCCAEARAAPHDLPPGEYPVGAAAGVRGGDRSPSSPRASAPRPCRRASPSSVPGAPLFDPAFSPRRRRRRAGCGGPGLRQRRAAPVSRVALVARRALRRAAARPAHRGPPGPATGRHPPGTATSLRPLGAGAGRAAAWLGRPAGAGARTSDGSGLVGRHGAGAAGDLLQLLPGARPQDRRR